jgi:hypothetical protein
MSFATRSGPPAPSHADMFAIPDRDADRVKLPFPRRRDRKSRPISKRDLKLFDSIVNLLSYATKQPAFTNNRRTVGKAGREALLTPTRSEALLVGVLAAGRRQTRKDCDVCRADN